MLALILLASRVEAGTIDKPKLRKLAELPTVSVSVSIRFSTAYGFTFNDEKPDPAVEIVRLRKQLQGDASDAERCQRLSRLYSKADREKESDEAAVKAISICRQQVREHPKDMRGSPNLARHCSIRTRRKKARNFCAAPSGRHPTNGEPG